MKKKLHEGMRIMEFGFWKIVTVISLEDKFLVNADNKKSEIIRQSQQMMCIFATTKFINIQTFSVIVHNTSDAI